MPFSFGIIDIIDIICVALVLFYCYRLMRNSRSLNIFVGIIIFALVWLIVSRVLQMKLLGTILDKLASAGIIALVVIFQDEVRRFFYNLGSSQRSGFMRFLFRNRGDKKVSLDNIAAVVAATMTMSRKKIGALIVLERNVHLDDIVASGDAIDAKINQRLIENIFFKNSPLHDGAMVISDHRIKAVGCILPLSSDTEIPKYLGLRHRAAKGVSERSDAVSIIVSEETGAISMCIKGIFKLNLTAEELEKTIIEEMKK
ncbi:MAG: diadenylate cyclase CdaA [Prevotellaceae bacterium]|nr:diadenylate cyclase CdaA [Prevotellaceae bacterium]